MMSSHLVTALILFCGAVSVFSQDEQPVFIESKLDGKVLTVTDVIVPPSGPYRRYGVSALALNTSIPQSWVFIEYSDGEGEIRSVGASHQNSLSTGLMCDNCFSYTYFYNFSAVTSDGSQLLLRLDLFGDEAACVSNPGNGAPIADSECDASDISQQWVIRDAPEVAEQEVDDEEEFDSEESDELYSLVFV